ncbi:MAG TPA: hypothetical protein VJV79_02875 [Polyangiaceae bacterium]|nr:hypothetical protein [Polyangiaceae bacterium]
MTTLERVRLRGVIRTETDRLGECQTLLDTDSYHEMIARSDPPRTVLDQLRRFVVHIAEQTKVFGGRANFPSTSAEAARLYIDEGIGSSSPFAGFLSAVRVAGYIDGSAHHVLYGEFSVQLTHQGWELAESLLRDGVTGDRAFVAMWFHPGMDEAFDKGFHVGLRKAGYEPFRVDRSAHNNKIDDEIISNIRKSRILVADLTGARPNVFYEAGFGAGLGRDVLYTCHADYVGYFLRCEPNASTPPAVESDSWFELISKQAFDIRQFLVMRWTTPDDLAKQLDDRIGRLGLRLPEKTGAVAT